MSQFEFMMGAITILVAIAVARLLEGLVDSVRQENYSLLASTWMLIKLSNICLYFLASWDARHIDEWMAIDLIGWATPAALIFMQAHLLVTAHPAQVTDWRVHFEHVRRSFFLLNTAFALSLIVNIFRDNSTTVEEFGLMFRIVILLISVIGVLTPNVRVHAVIAIIAASLQILGLLAVSKIIG